MSEFCGKCDVYDHYGDCSDEYLQNSRFFIWSADGRRHELVINNQKDLAKYYPYLVASAGTDKNSTCVNISNRCFIDREEEEMIGWVKKALVKYYNKCKRTKASYDKDTALKQACYFEPEEWEKTLADRVGECGEKANTKDLHRRMHEHYRQCWCKKLIELGYAKDEARMWVYGWERMFNEQKEKKSKEEDIGSTQN